MTEYVLGGLAVFILGLAAGLALRIGREEEAYLRGIAIGRRQGRAQAVRK